MPQNATSYFCFLSFHFDSFVREFRRQTIIYVGRDLHRMLLRLGTPARPKLELESWLALQTWVLLLLLLWAEHDVEHWQSEWTATEERKPMNGIALYGNTPRDSKFPIDLRDERPMSESYGSKRKSQGLMYLGSSSSSRVQSTSQPPIIVLYIHGWVVNVNIKQLKPESKFVRFRSSWCYLKLQPCSNTDLTWMTHSSPSKNREIIYIVFILHNSRTITRYYTNELDLPRWVPR